MTDFAAQVRWDILPYAYGNGLDLGCGDGRPHDYFHGIDIRPGSGPKGPNQIMDARKLDRFADKSHDFVFSSYLLNELVVDPTNNLEAIVKEWWRVLKDDGYLILYLPIVVGDAQGCGACNPKLIVDAMVPLRPWQLVEARINGEQFFHVYRKCDRPTTLAEPKPEKQCAIIKLGAHGDALWASSVLAGLKEQGYHTILYTQETGEEVLRHDPHIDQMIKFESRVPMAELGELFRWMETKYKECRILVECVEGTLLPAPQKIQYHFPLDARHITMNVNYLDMHHMVGKIPLFPKRQKFYPSTEEMTWANEFRSHLQPFVVVLVPNGSSVSKMWPYTGELVKRLLAREDVTVVMLGDERGQIFEPHPRFIKTGLGWNVRKAMTFCQLANVVAGQETGLLNSVAFEKEVRKVVLLTHSSVENLTRDWPNCEAIRTLPPCAGESGCHRLHYDFSFCVKDEKTQAAACQTLITVDRVMEAIQPGIEKIEIAA